MNVIVLNYKEEFITFLNNDYLDITEHYELGKIRYIDVEYYMQNINEARELFRPGNKLWVQDDNNLSDCLYVINNEVTRDYFKENNVKFTAEDVIVELNYVPFFKQTDITTANGFTIGTTAGQQNVKVDYKALDYWFGEYFQIGIIQNTVNTERSKISPKGTMTKMELLRFIEEETCNIFVPRYEKDTKDNTIHRFLDYLNPNSNDNNWNTTFKWEASSEVDPNNITVSLKDDQDNVIGDLEWNGATDLGMSSSSDVVEVTIKYQKPNLSCSVNNRSFTATNLIIGEVGEVETGTNGITNIVINNDVGDASRIDSNLSTTVTEASIGEYNLPRHCTFEVYDTNTNTILFRHGVNPTCGDVHGDVLDLTYNVENIEYTINEEDTYTAISPKLKMDSGSTNALTYEDYNTIINDWVNLSVNKGDRIPMIVERKTEQAQPTDNYMAQSTISDNYYARPLKPNDNEENNDYEYWRATAYWAAPFTKVSGQMHIEDPEVTSVEYNHVLTRPDTTCPYGPMGSPKMGIVETSDENKYAIYNDVALKLMDKRYPKIEVDVDVANYKKGKYNDYGVYDKVFVKIPGFEGLLTAIVDKTTKKAHDISKNTVHLTNFSINAKVSTKETYIEGDNISFKYPATSTFTCTLKDMSGSTIVPVANKLVNIAIWKYNDTGQLEFRKTYAKITGNNGVVSLPLALSPADYVVRCDFPGDLEYTASSADFDVNVSGTIETPKTTTTSTATTTTTTTDRYWDKYGRSPDGKYIKAIGRPSAAGEVSKYGYTFWDTEFNRKCPHCGSTELYWGIFWAGNEYSNWGKFPATGRKEGGSAEGHIFCKKCDADWSVFGKDHGLGKTKNLTVHKSPKKTTKSEAYNLKNGKVKYDTVTTTVASTNNSKDTTRAAPKWSVNKTVKEWALKKVGSSTGEAAAKKLATACQNLRYDYYCGFNRSPKTVLSKGGGNCCDQARLFLMCMDAVGLSSEYKLQYVAVCCSSRGVGHCFTKITNKSTGKWKYVDPCKQSGGGAWGHYVTGWGSPPGRLTNYPTTPYS